MIIIEQKIESAWQRIWLESVIGLLVGAFAICFLSQPLGAEVGEAEQQELVELVEAIQTGLSALPEPERAHKCGTTPLLQYREIKEQLPLSLKRQSAQLVRPILALSYDSPSGYFRIHYATSGTDAVLNPATDNVGPLNIAGADGIPDYINSVADIFDSVRLNILGDTLSGFLGYPVPPRDDLYPGPDSAFVDSLYDVYVLDLGGQFFGLTQSESQATGYFNGDPFAPYTSYIEIDNDYFEASYSSFNNYRVNPLDAVRVTAAHEYFHAVHFGIDAFEFEYGTPNRFYWYEISSVAMEEYLYDDVNDYYSYLGSLFGSTPFREPHRSLQTFSNFGTDADFAYAYGIFGMFLNDEFGPGLMRGIWRGCGRQGPDFLRAIDSALIAHTAGEYDFNLALHEFGIRMALTGTRAKYAPPGRKLDEAEFFPMITDTTTFTVDTLVARPYPAVHKSYPFNVFSLNQEPPPEANSNTIIFLKDVFTVTGGCFRPLTLIPSVTFGSSNIEPRLALVGIPAANDAEAFILSVPHDQVFLDTSILVAPADFCQTAQLFVDSFACHDSVEITFDALTFDPLTCDTLTSPPDSFRLIVMNQIPALELREAGAYEEALLIITQSTTDTADYAELFGVSEYRFAYAVFNSATFSPDTTGQPYQFVASYPNPVRPEDNSVTILVRRDSLSVPTGSVRLKATIYTEAGETVRDNLNFIDRGRELEIPWDLRNQSGREVASGVYIAHVTLVNVSDGSVLQSATSKLLIIR